MKCKMKNDILKICKGYNEIKTNKVKKECYLIERERERNVLFNDALNTFYLRLYIWRQTYG